MGASTHVSHVQEAQSGMKIKGLFKKESARIKELEEEVYSLRRTIAEATASRMLQYASDGKVPLVFQVKDISKDGIITFVCENLSTPTIHMRKEDVLTVQVTI